jgi:phosphomannomutase
MVKDKYATGNAPSSAKELFDRIAAAYPEARLDRRDGLRLDWPDRWAHVRSSNTEPIVRVITEAADPGTARALADELGRRVSAGRES